VQEMVPKHELPNIAFVKCCFGMALRWGMATLNYFKLSQLLGNFGFVMKMLLHCQHMDCLEFVTSS
jgi:hypothetical protein